MAFDYDSVDVDDEVVRSIAADISGSGKPTPLSPEEKEQRRIEHEQWLARCRERDEQQRLEFERRQAEAAALEQAEADRQAAIAAAQARERAKAELGKQRSRQAHDRTLSDLLDRSIRAEQHRLGLIRAATFQRQRQRLSAALDNAIATRFPPAPPEPEIVYVQEDDGSADLGSRNFDPAKWAKKPRSWW